MAPEDAPWSLAAGELRGMRQLLQLQPDSTACITSLDSFVGNNLTGPWLAGVNTGVTAPHPMFPDFMPSGVAPLYSFVAVT